MSLQNPENFVTYGEFTYEAGSVTEELAAVEQTIESVGEPTMAVDLRARKTALRVLSLLEDANADFEAQRYESALDCYEKLSKELLSLLNSDIERRTVPEVWPSGSEIVRATSQVAANLISQLTPGRRRVPPALPDTELQFEEIEQTRPIPKVTLSDESEPAAANTIERANAAATQGRWEDAATLYERSMQDISDRSQRADILLNLGAMKVQMDRIDEAQEKFSESKQIYEEVEDDLGVAQALHNEGLTLAKAGDDDGAISTLQQAREIAGLSGTLVPAGATGQPGAEGEPEHGGSSDPDDESEAGSESEPTGGFRPATGSISFTNLQPGLGQPTTIEPTLESLGDSTHTGVPLQPGSEIGPQLETGSEGLATLGSQDMTLRLRSAQSDAVVPNVPIETPVRERQDPAERVLHLKSGGETATLTWSEEQLLAPEELRGVWEGRRNLENLTGIGIDIDTPAGVLANLGHLYHLVAPVRMGDCHHELGNFQKAEREYHRAAEYENVNPTLEGADLWRRLAENAISWGDTLYREGDPEMAASIYERLTTPALEASNSFLYEVDSLQPTGERVSDWLQLEEGNEEQPELNPAIAQTLHTVRRRWANLNAGLGFFGDEMATVPPFTFGYLQEVARYFANQAIRAEKRYIEFYNRFEQGQLKRKQLEQAAQEAKKNVEAAREKRTVAKESEEAAEASVDQAEVRHQNAREQLREFEETAWERKALAQAIARGNAFSGRSNPDLDYKIGDTDYSGKRHETLQELTKRKTEISNELQKKRMADTIDQAQAAKEAAEEQADVAEARHEAAKTEYQAAVQRANHAEEMRDAFEDQRFTPQLWGRMAKVMEQLADEALNRAVEVARLMQQAYNFEELDDLDRIDDSYEIGYTGDTLGGNMLLSDIDSFTAHRVSDVTTKPNQVKWPISLSEEYPGQFLGFTRTGRLEFDIDLERVRLAHPGTYGHKLKGVELEVDGFLPPDGLHGRLTNSGIGRMRDEFGEDELRIQPAETMILSRYDRRRDSVIMRPPKDMRELFEDNAVASGWTLEVPPSANDVDLQEIFDVRLVLYFECRYDRDLFKRDTEFRDGRSDIDFERTRAVYLRQHFPDAYYQLREHGETSIKLDGDDFPKNHTRPTLQSLSLGLVSDDEHSLEGTTLQVTYPGRSEPIDVTVGADDVVPSSELPMDGAPAALGSYTVVVDEEQAERTEAIEDLVLVTDYRFTPVEDQ